MATQVRCKKCKRSDGLVRYPQGDEKCAIEETVLTRAYKCSRCKVITQVPIFGI